MVSRRRLRVFGLLAFLTILATMYFTSAARQTRTSGFYTKTATALAEKDALARAAEEETAASERERKAGRERDKEDAVQRRLREAEVAAKEKANRKGEEVHRAVTGEIRQEVLAGEGDEDEKSGGGANDDEEDDDGRSVAGRVRVKGNVKGKGARESGTPGVVWRGPAGEKGRKAEEKGKTEEEKAEEHEVKEELNAILKKSPIIIFSKSYCPHSRKAKQILLQQYRITPAPYVVELDEHPLGAQLQATLGRKTGRKTVPNVLISGLSVGGGDEIEALHREGKLADKVRQLAGKRVTEAEYIEPKTGGDEEDEYEEKEGLRRRRRRRAARRA